MKQKNPLYLVKGKTVHPTKSLWEYVVIKFNLRPILNILNQIFQFILEQVKDYPSFVTAKNFVDQFINRLHQLKERFS
ncbi:MAG TPA: hypothetical protein VKY27_08030 [Bacteriovoracaceae bacterium]|nr:hypothetical protein [Bacteriovoracaceae bacterium]